MKSLSKANQLIFKNGIHLPLLSKKPIADPAIGACPVF
jgi:hypothetical protein